MSVFVLLTKSPLFRLEWLARLCIALDHGMRNAFAAKSMAMRGTSSTKMHTVDHTGSTVHSTEEKRAAIYLQFKEARAVRSCGIYLIVLLIGNLYVGARLLIHPQTIL